MLNTASNRNFSESNRSGAPDDGTGSEPESEPRSQPSTCSEHQPRSPAARSQWLLPRAPASPGTYAGVTSPARHQLPRASASPGTYAVAGDALMALVAGVAAPGMRAAFRDPQSSGLAAPAGAGEAGGLAEAMLPMARTGVNGDLLRLTA